MKLSVLTLVLVSVLSELFVLAGEDYPNANKVLYEDMTAYITDVLTPFFEQETSEGLLISGGSYSHYQI